MHRILLFVIYSCFVIALCTPEVAAQPPEGQREQRERGQFGGAPGGTRQPRAARQPVEAQPAPPPVIVYPTTNAPADGEEVADEEGVADEEVTDGAEVADGGETPEPPPFVPPPPQPWDAPARKLPDVAVGERLKLDAGQRQRITQIVQEQVDEIARTQVAGATEAQYLEIYKKYEERLLDVLTATQKSVLAAGLEEPTIKMVFDRQPWRDVLQLIADQAKMQLVLDAPPPGTFTFSSPETFTITQALDIIGNDLVTRGYTLTRSGDQRMLHLLNLNNPIPNWAFPTVRVEELQGRASSEFVSVAHDFSRRPLDTVVAAIEPLKGPFTRVFPSGNTVTVIDRVETHLAIRKVIDSIYNPPAPPQPVQRPPTPDPPPPEWRTYTIEKNDPDYVLTTFGEWVQGMRTLRLPGSRTVHIFVRPGEHETLEGILRMMEVDVEATATSTAASKGNKKIRLVSIAPYIESQGVPADASTLQRLQQLQERQQPQLQQPSQPRVPRSGVAPGGGFPGRGQRSGLGGPGGQSGGTGPEGSPMPVIPPGIEIDQLNQNQIIGLELIAILRKQFPDASISDMPFGDRLIISASDEDHKEINEFMESLLPGKDKATFLKFYSFTDPVKKISNGMVQQLQTLFPKVVMFLDTEQGQLMVLATSKEHDTLDKVIAEFERVALQTASANTRPMVTYRLSSTTFPSFLQSIQQLVVQDKLRGYSQVEDSQRNQVLIWATPEQHSLIRVVHAELTGQAQQQPGDVSAVADAVILISPKNISIDTLITVLEDVYPTARITRDDLREQVIIRVRPEQKEALQMLLTQLDAADPEEEKRFFKAYPIDMGFYSLSGFNYYRPAEFVADLEKITPRARIVYDAQSQQIVVWGTEEEHAAIEKAIQHLLGDKDAKVFELVPLHRALWGNIAPVIRRIYPAANVTPGDNGMLIVEGHPRIIPKVVELLKILDPVELSENAPVVMFYKFEKEPTPTVVYGLQLLAPTATIIQDSGNRQIMVIAKPAEQKVIEKSTDLIVQSFTTPEKEMRRFQLRRLANWTVDNLIRRKFPELIPTFDYNVPGVIIVEGDPALFPAVEAFIDMIDPAEPSAHAPVVSFYKIKDLSPTMVWGLQPLAPAAQIVADYPNQQIMVVAKPADQETIKTSVKLIADTFSPLERKIERFDLQRMPYWRVTAVIQRMYPPPAVIVHWDNSGHILVVESTPELLVKVGELIALLDPVEPSENDPVVKFYTLETEPTDILVTSLQQLSPTATITPDKEGKQLMVIAKPAEHKIIEANAKSIASTFTPPEEPMLVIYTTTNEEQERLSAFIDTAAITANLRTVQIIPEKTPERANRLTIWARPTEHKVIAAILTQIQDSHAAVPDRQLKSFPMSIGDLTIAENILKTSHPDAMTFPDAAGNRLLVWATDEDMKKVTETLRIQGSIDDRQMLAYPIAGASTEIAKTAIMDVFQGLKITVEPQTRKLLIWASPDEHAQITDIVEQINKEVDPESELAEKFLAYSAHNIDAAMILPLFQKLIPDADVHATPGSDKIIVRARARDHKRLEELFAKLREKDETERLQLVIYPFGETDPVMVEVLLRNQLKDAESMSPDELVQRASTIYYYERESRRRALMPYYYSFNNYQQPAQQTPTITIGYFNVDPSARAVYVLATAEQHKEVKDSIEQLVAAGEQQGIKPVVRRYVLNEWDLWDVETIIRQVAPSAFIQQIYTRIMRVDPDYGYSYTDYNYSREFLAYTRENEHEKLEALIAELNNQSETGKKELRTFTLPDGSPYSRERIVAAIQQVFSDVTPMAGASANQLLIWAPKYRLEQIQQLVDDVSQPLPEGVRTITKAYPLLYISVEEATAWLSALYPNAVFDPGKLSAALPAQRPGRFQPPRPQQPPLQRFPRPDDANFIVVVATPLEQIEIEKTLGELDQDLPDSLKLVPRTYTLDDLPPGALGQFNIALGRAFPKVVATPVQQTSVMVVATENDHKKVADFVKTYQEDSERLRPVLEVYTLERQNFFQIQPLLQRIAPPPAWVAPGSRPEQVVVFATPREQQDIAKALAALETTADTETDIHQNLRVYKLGAEPVPGMYPARAQFTQDILMQQFPGVLTFPISQTELIVWARPEAHEKISELLDVISESYPYPVLKRYFFKYTMPAEGAAILQQAFAGQAQITTQPATGDLLVFATPDIHEKIAANIAELDVPRPVALEAVPKTYDVSDLPPGTFWITADQIRTALAGRAQVMQGIVPGQMVVVGVPADQERVDAIIKQLLEQQPAAAAVLEVYDIHRGNARAVAPLVLHIAPNAQIDYGTNPNQMLVWTRESNHVKIKDMIDQLNKSDADISLKVHYFQHVTLSEAWSILYQVFYGSATMTPRANDLLVFATPEVHARIEASIAEFDVPRPAELELLPQSYDVSDLPRDTFWTVAGQIRLATQYRAEVTPGAIQGQMIVVGKQADQERAKAIINRILEERPGASAVVQTYFVNRGNARTVVEQLVVQIAPNARSYPGTTVNQIVVWAKTSEHEKIGKAIDKLNETDPDVTLKVYRTGSQRAANAISLLTQQHPGLLVFQTTPSELVAWVTSTEHKTISQTLETLAIAFPEPTMKTYTFRHIPLAEAFTTLNQAFYGIATAMYQRPSTQDMLVYATPDVHARIAASIEGFDVASPNTEPKPKTYDLSDLTPTAFYQALYYIPAAFQGRIQAMSGVVPGQLIVVGKPADIEKVDEMVEQMLSERVVASAKLKVYTIERSSDVQSIMTMIPVVAPNARANYGTNLNQILVLAREFDHEKIQDVINKMDDAGVVKVYQGHSLKNINALGAENALLFLRDRDGLDLTYQFDTWNNQFFVWASKEDQQKVADVLAGLRTEDRDLLTVVLQRVEPAVAQAAINTLFFDEPAAVRPNVNIDLDTNTILVQGVPVQLERVRKLLRDMGERIPDQNQSGAQAPGPSHIRILRLQSPEMLKELQKIWGESQLNPLQIIQPSETPSQFSVEDEVLRENTSASEQEEKESADISDEKTDGAESDWEYAAPPVYVVVGEDGSLMITSSDTDALDRLEMFLKRIESGIVYEGRDFTVLSVRNISAAVVAQRANQILSLQATSRGLGQPSATFATPGQQTQVPFSLFPDLTTNTITVRGSRYWRQEAAKLIAMFDVSDWGGVQIAQKPLTVQVENTDVNTVYREVMNVYQPRLMTTLLPGGVQPRIVVNATKSALEIFAPEPLATELKEYAKEVDRKAKEEPIRNLHVIPLNVKAAVVERILMQAEAARLRQQQVAMQMSGMIPNVVMPMQPFQMMPMQPMQTMPMQPFGTPGSMQRGQRAF